MSVCVIGVPHGPDLDASPPNWEDVGVCVASSSGDDDIGPVYVASAPVASSWPYAPMV